MKIINNTCLILLPIALAGCSSMSPERCQTADWYNQGFSDGQKGHQRDKVNDYRQDCAVANIQVNTTRWQEGYEKGNLAYCVPENGYRIGKNGQTYRGVCKNKAFLTQYNKGYRQYEIKQEILTLDRRIDCLMHALRYEKDEYKRREIHYQIRELQRDLDRLRYPRLFLDLVM